MVQGGRPSGRAMKDPNASDYLVGVVGAGTMGQGIIQVAAQGGMRTLILDSRNGVAEAGRKTVAARIERLVEEDYTANNLSFGLGFSRILSENLTAEAGIGYLYSDVQEPGGPTTGH